MKKLTLLILFTSTFLYPQMKVDTIKETVSFSKIYNVEKTKKEIHQKAQEWIAINFKDSNEVIKLNTDNKIIAKGFFNVSYGNKVSTVTSKVYFILEVAFKESRYKLDLHTFNLIEGGNTLPVKDYYLSNDYDYYLKILKEQVSHYTDKATVKYYNKLFTKPDKLKEFFEKYKLISNQIKSSIDSEVEATSESLFKYVSKEAKEDW